MDWPLDENVSEGATGRLTFPSGLKSAFTHLGQELLTVLRVPSNAQSGRLHFRLRSWADPFGVQGNPVFTQFVYKVSYGIITSYSLIFRFRHGVWHLCLSVVGSP